MNLERLTVILNEELSSRGWTVRTLAKEADVHYETVRRVVRGIGAPSLENATKLLVAVDRTLPLGVEEVGPKEVAP